MSGKTRAPAHQTFAIAWFGLALSVAPDAIACTWREPARTYPEGIRWSCMPTYTVDGDTLHARCNGQPGTVSIRLRGVDTDERHHDRWEEAREELRRRTAGQVLTVLPHHDSYKRVVADVLAGGVDVGAAMDVAGWSKAGCPKR